MKNVGGSSEKQSGRGKTTPDSESSQRDSSLAFCRRLVLKDLTKLIHPSCRSMEAKGFVLKGGKRGFAAVGQNFSESLDGAGKSDRTE